MCEHEVVAAERVEWSWWLEMHLADRIVRKTRVGEAEVSTVFMGLDHRVGEGTPLVFETLVFGGEMDGEMDRYSTWDEAERGHEVMVSSLRAKTP